MGNPLRENQQLDVWLQRLSHLSQFGLLLFTVGAIYFTVIPLYQKALLDEAIAKKEGELKDANAALENAYARVRAAVIKDYVFFAGAECTGVLDPPESLTGLGKSASARPSLAERRFAIDVPACLTKVAKESVLLRDLRPVDRKVLDQKIVALGEELSTLKLRAMAQHSEVPSRAAANPNALPPPDGFTGRMLEFLSTRESPERHQQLVREAAIKAEQSRIGVAYADAIRQRVATLRDIEWVKKL